MTAESELAALRVELQAARDDRAAMLGALGEPCAECGHIDWRADPNEYLDRMEAAEAALQAAQEALRWRESVTRDVIHGLRHQPEISREEIAGMLERDLGEQAAAFDVPEPNREP